ncbi:MAG: hypothetical protein LBS57_12305, partial [Treponema sp.]|nr:hypothetical protein [Treponema sp.]
FPPVRRSLENSRFYLPRGAYGGLKAASLYSVLKLLLCAGRMLPFRITALNGLLFCASCPPLFPANYALTLPAGGRFFYGRYLTRFFSF